MNQSWRERGQEKQGSIMQCRVQRTKLKLQPPPQTWILACELINELRWLADLLKLLKSHHIGLHGRVQHAHGTHVTTKLPISHHSGTLTII